jgi:hypothetical protein
VRASKVASLCLSLLVATGAAAEAPVRNGFVLDPQGIDVAEILPGGPPRDGIPALDHPPHVPASESPWPDAADVVGVAWNGEARAYPLAILVWHELVNDTVGGRAILVSCGTGIVFDRRVDGTDGPNGTEGAARSFGVSGLLYRSDLLLYDRETESLWSQISSEAVTGPSQGRRLSQLRARIMPLGHWRKAHPHTRVLSRATGHQRDYDRTPYGDYAVSEQLMFPVPSDRRYHPKTPTLGLRLPGVAARAYPAVEIARAGGVVEERFGGHSVRVVYEPEAQIFEVQAPSEIEVVEGFWFAWAAFHPETSVGKPHTTRWTGGGTMKSQTPATPARQGATPPPPSGGYGGPFARRLTSGPPAVRSSRRGAPRGKIGSIAPRGPILRID